MLRYKSTKDLESKTGTIKKSPEITLIGIHNQDPSILYIQFAVGERHFMYQRNIHSKVEHVKELFYGTSEHIRTIEPNEEEILIGAIRFLPKTRRTIANY